MMRSLLIVVSAVGLMACGARIDPLRTERVALGRVASAPVEADVPAHVAAMFSSQVLSDLVAVALAAGERGSGEFDLPTPAGRTILRVESQEIRNPIRLTEASCEDCVRVTGTMSGTVQATVGQMSVNTKAGVHTGIPVHVRAVTVGRGSDIVVTPRWDNRTELDVQLMGLPLGGMGINRAITRGVREQLDGRDITVVSLPADGPLPLRGVHVDEGQRVRASLRVVGATPAPQAPDTLESGVWAGVSTETARAWFDAYALRHGTKKWAFRLAELTGEDNVLTGVLDVYRLRRNPKRRQFKVVLALGQLGGRWTVTENAVTRMAVGPDLTGGIIRNKIEQRISSIVDDDLLTGGVIPVGPVRLQYQVKDIVIDDGSVQVWMGVSRP